MLLPVYAALAAAIVFYFLMPVGGAFALRAQWRRFRDRVSSLAATPRLRYRDVAAAAREGRILVGSYRLHGSIEALEGSTRVWIRGVEVSALADLSRAPLYVLGPRTDEGSAETSSVNRIKWSSLSTLAEGTSVLVAGRLILEEGRPVFVDDPEEGLLAVFHEGGAEHLPSRLMSAGRAANEYWNYLTPVSMAAGLVAISAMLLLFGPSLFPTQRVLVFLAGAGPVLPLAPPGLALFIFYRASWRRALAARATRDVLKLPLSYAAGLGAGEYLRRILKKGELPGGSVVLLGEPKAAGKEAFPFTLFAPVDPNDPLAETFVVEGEPEARAKNAAGEAAFCAAASGLALGLAVLVNFALAFTIWRAAL